MKNSIIVILVLSLTPLAFTCTASACYITDNTIVTFYGYPDNNPPGASTSYDCGRKYLAGGTGTYDDPLTFATAEGEYQQCEIIYLPYLQKYLRYEDFCDQCTSDWSNGQAHIDVWTGFNTVNGGQAQVDCEDALTPGNQGVVRQPSSNLQVNAVPLFQNGNCNTASATNLKNNPLDYCNGGGTGGGTPGSPGGGANNPPGGGADNPPGGSCSWPGHCQGALCESDDDCADALTCQKGSCL